MSNQIKAHDKLRAAMVRAGMTQERLAKAMGLSISAFNLKINGHREFTLSECILAAKKIGKTLDEIFFNDDVPKQQQKRGA